MTLRQDLCLVNIVESIFCRGLSLGPGSGWLSVQQCWLLDAQGRRRPPMPKAT